MARLLPVVAEDSNPAELLDRDLGLAWPICSHEADVLPGLQAARRVQHLVPRRHRRDEVGGQRLLSARRHFDAELRRGRLRSRHVEVPDRHPPPAGQKRPRRRAAVHARADHRSDAGVLAAQRLGSQDRRRAGPQRRHRACVEHGDGHAVRGVRQQHEPGDRREAERRVARERRHPFQQREASPERRHRAEVAGGIRRHVDLRRHRPLAARVGDERVPDDLDRALGRDGGLDVPPPEDGNPGQTALTEATSCSSAAFASAKSITVFGS